MYITSGNDIWKSNTYTLTACAQGRTSIIITCVFLHQRFQNLALLRRKIIHPKDYTLNLGRANFLFLHQTLQSLLKLIHITIFHSGEFISSWSGPDKFPSEEMAMFILRLTSQKQTFLTWFVPWHQAALQPLQAWCAAKGKIKIQMMGNKQPIFWSQRFRQCRPNFIFIIFYFQKIDFQASYKMD